MPESLTAEDIFAAQDTADLKKVYVREWKGHVYLRQITAGERDEFEAESFQAREEGRPRNVRARFAALVCCDATGKRLFPRPMDPQLLREKSGAALDLIWEAGAKHNGMGERTESEQTEADKTAEKNSEATAAAG